MNDTLCSHEFYRQGYFFIMAIDSVLYVTNVLYCPYLNK